MAEPWYELAWHAWRVQRLRFDQISELLAAEGWCVSPHLVQDVVLARAGSQLAWHDLRRELQAGHPDPPGRYDTHARGRT